MRLVATARYVAQLSDVNLQDVPEVAFEMILQQSHVSSPVPGAQFEELEVKQPPHLFRKLRRVWYRRASDQQGRDQRSSVQGGDDLPPDKVMLVIQPTTTTSVRGPHPSRPNQHYHRTGVHRRLLDSPRKYLTRLDAELVQEDVFRAPAASQRLV